MPKRVDHEERRRQIIEAVCRITVKGGLASATFREVAAEAGVSVRLVQYYFGTKDELMLSTQRHVAGRATARITERVQKAGSSPREVLRAILTSFIPTDDESRENMLMFVALHTQTLVEPASLPRRSARRSRRAAHDDRASSCDGDACARVSIPAWKRPCPRRSRAEPGPGRARRIATVPTQAIAVIDYALGRALL